MSEDKILKRTLDDNTELFRQAMKLLDQYHEADDMLKEALSLLMDYDDELGRMIRRDPTYANYIRQKELLALAERHGKLIEKVKEGKNDDTLHM